MVTPQKMIGELLLNRNIITRDQLDAALGKQQKTGEKLGRLLVREGFLTEQQLLEILELVLGIPHVQIGKLNINPEAVKLLPPRLIRFHKILPISVRKRNITLAMADPLNHQALDDVRMVTGRDVTPVLASEKELDIAIRQFLAFRLDPNIDIILSELNQEGKLPAPNTKDIPLTRTEDEAPLIRVVNSIMLQAVQGRCSDVHVEPRENDIGIRYRVDGELYEVLTLPKALAAAIVSRIKIMAGMDIAERRLPQDGRFQMKVENREVDFRVSTLPVIHGEKAALRILDRANVLTRIEQLGLSSHNQQRLLALSRRPYGMLLVTGPTGSGKTTMLYSILGEINSVEKNIVTLEDPVEYSIPGINQVQVNPKAGVTFAGGLRSVLRQDPDIIMVGEIRDFETAQLAVQAASTGHLVLSTLHTNDAVGAIARLIDMGIEGYLLSDSVAGVVSQRLVRQLCENCKSKYILDEDTAKRLGISEEKGGEFYRATGCNMCRQLGYRGRIALHEIMIIGPGTKHHIYRGEHLHDSLERAAIEEEMITIKIDGINKAKQGITSLEEVMKVMFSGG